MARRSNQEEDVEFDDPLFSPTKVAFLAILLVLVFVVSAASVTRPKDATPSPALTDLLLNRAQEVFKIVQADVNKIDADELMRLASGVASQAAETELAQSLKKQVASQAVDLQEKVKGEATQAATQVASAAAKQAQSFFWEQTAGRLVDWLEANKPR